VLHGGEAVGDGKAGAARFQRLERALHHELARRVERAGRLVEKQDRSIGEQRPRDGKPLALAAGERRAALAERRVEALRQTGDELPGVGALAGFEHFFAARLRTPVAHVLEHAGGEDHRLLRHHRDERARRARVHVAELHAADAHRAPLRIVEAQQQGEHGRLARAGRADQRDPFAGRHAQRELAQRRNLGARGVSELDSVEPDLGMHRFR
jgi:hypothetical protein